MPIPQDVNTDVAIGQIIPNGPAFVLARRRAKLGS